MYGSLKENYERIRNRHSRGNLHLRPLIPLLSQCLRCCCGVMLGVVAPALTSPLPGLLSSPLSNPFATYSVFPPVRGFRLGFSSVRFAQASSRPPLFGCSCRSHGFPLFDILSASSNNWLATPIAFRAAVGGSDEMETTSSSYDAQAIGPQEQPSPMRSPQEDIPGQQEASPTATIFVAGSTGNTGRRIVNQLLSKGFQVRAGARDIGKAKEILPSSPSLQIVNADVSESPDKLAEAIAGAQVVICATGFSRSWDPFAPWKVDYFGTLNLVKACDKAGVKRFILISSILVNGAAMGQFLNPAYIILNVFGLVLIAKLQAELYIRKSVINYTIIRPGGLRNDPPVANLVMEPEDTLYEGSISRDQVAEVAVEAISCTESSYKVVEIISRSEAPKRTIKELFQSIRQS